MEHQKTIPNPISKTGIGSLNIVKQHDLAMVPINEITFEDASLFVKSAKKLRGKIVNNEVYSLKCPFTLFC